MQIELTLYFSDYWADGARQQIPHEWAEEIANLSDWNAKYARLKELMYEYTKDVLLKMKEQDTLPEYISLGNEMQGGLLYDAKGTYDYGRTKNFGNLAGLLNSAAKAVREVAPDTKIVLHLDGKRSQYQNFFDNCKNYNVDYDIIGPSYYPFWTGDTVDTVVGFYNWLIDCYDKDILVMETGYNFDDEKASGGAGQLSNNGPYDSVYPSSPEGQRAFMEEVFQGLRQVSGGRCIGDLYWDPMMINQDGVGWAMVEGKDGAEDYAGDNLVSNTTLFDFDGKALPAFDAYKNNGYTPNKVGIGGTITDNSGNKAKNKTVTLAVNSTEYKVNTDKMGGYFARVPYADSITVSANGASNQPYTLDMTTDNLKTGLDFNITVDLPDDNHETDTEPETENLLVNGGFETELVTGGDWKFTDKGKWYAYNDANSGVSRDDTEKTEGSSSAKLATGGIGQRVTLETGKTYAVRAKVKGSGKVNIGVYNGTAEWPVGGANLITSKAIDLTNDWTEQSLEITNTAAQDYIIYIDNFGVNGTCSIDEIVLSEKTNIISSFTANESESGVDYSVSYSTNKKNAVLYVALYDENGVLLGCKKDITEGSFETELSEGKTYTAKAFLWEDMKPMDMKTDSFVCGDMSAYMFVHFVGAEGSADDEQIYFSVSKDGKNWTTLNNKKPVLKSNVGEKGIRDPYIMRSPKDGKFYIVATDLSIYNRGGDWDCTNGASDKSGSKNIIVWESDNLTDWSEAKLANVAPSDAGCFWAPECVWDEDKQAYMIFGACSTSDNNYGIMRIFKTYTTDFENFSTPEVFMDRRKSKGDGTSDVGVIDTTIIKGNDGKYYRIFKTDRIEMESADSLDGQWKEVSNNIHSIASNVEGPTICKLNGSDEWCVLVDGLNRPGSGGMSEKGYHPMTTDNLSSGQFTASDVITMPTDITIRHGAIMPITSKEYGTLMKAYQ